MPNPFMWCDLSSFDTAEARRFYATLFGWTFQDGQGPDGSPYFFARSGWQARAGIFEMPKKLQKLNLPSFWMSYIQVPSVDDAVETARGFDGAIIELAPTAFDDQSRIALIRDPSGAGFTVYQGPDLDARAGAHGGHIWNVHHSGDVAVVGDFYGALFRWSFCDRGQGVFEIRDASGAVIAHAEQLDDALRSGFQYWMPVFAVDDTEEAGRAAQQLGGSVSYRFDDGRVMLRDTQGASLLINAI